MKRWLVPLGLLLLAVLIYPFSNGYIQQLLELIFIFAGVGFAWNIIGGYAGQLSLGHAAFFGIGAYTFAILSSFWGIWAALLAGGILSLVLSIPIGWLTFRLRGPYFSLGTIAVAVLLNTLANNQLADITQGSAGMIMDSLGNRDTFYFLTLAFLVLSFWVMWWISESKMGYYLMAIREDEDTAQTITINTTAYKVYALMISAFLTGIGGVLYASGILGTIQPDYVFGFGISNQIVFLVILGGAGTVYGPLVGSVILQFSSEFLKNTIGNLSFIRDASAFAFFVYGVLIILVILYMPDGIVGTIAKRWKGRRGHELAGSQSNS